jgi:hypothetical protein
LKKDPPPPITWSQPAWNPYRPFDGFGNNFNINNGGGGWGSNFNNNNAGMIIGNNLALENDMSDNMVSSTRAPHLSTTTQSAVPEREATPVISDKVRSDFRETWIWTTLNVR